MDFSCRVGVRMVTIVGSFYLCWGGVMELTVEAILVEPADPSAGGDLEVIETPPGTPLGCEGSRVAVKLGLEKRDRRLRHRIGPRRQRHPIPPVSTEPSGHPSVPPVVRERVRVRGASPDVGRGPADAMEIGMTRATTSCVVGNARRLRCRRLRLVTSSPYRRPSRPKCKGKVGMPENPSVPLLHRESELLRQRS